MEFNRIIKLLRKERGITQKQAAEDLGVSQALLSHYEKGIRECGLDFVVRVADYYNVSCDYLLGRSAERNGMMLSAEDIPNPDKMKDNIYHGSVLPTMNKKLISNSLNVLYAKIGECHSKALTTEVSQCGGPAGRRSAARRRGRGRPVLPRHDHREPDPGIPAVYSQPAQSGQDQRDPRPGTDRRGPHLSLCETSVNSAVFCLHLRAKDVINKIEHFHRTS